jgi:hypothetical protein
MEYCGSGDLGHVIKDLQAKRQFAEENFVWSMVSQLVTALYRCHYGVDAPEVASGHSPLEVLEESQHKVWPSHHRRACIGIWTFDSTPLASFEKLTGIRNSTNSTKKLSTLLTSQNNLGCHPEPTSPSSAESNYNSFFDNPQSFGINHEQLCEVSVHLTG